ncbi:unnamed protein product [Clonostachys rhizophaga]|uniref:Uncharacterized protein n=1 Tax=Clonostachys rhizophaga TaxID=160324 RepID=A0A9N9YQQ7_9HYPO|nr:unnamed protein product [Clonostachys rhizophaga]
MDALLRDRSDVSSLQSDMRKTKSLVIVVSDENPLASRRIVWAIRKLRVQECDAFFGQLGRFRRSTSDEGLIGPFIAIHDESSDFGKQEGHVPEQTPLPLLYLIIQPRNNPFGRSLENGEL